jgi:FkbM family methyltransferase
MRGCLKSISVKFPLRIPSRSTSILIAAFALAALSPFLFFHHSNCPSTRVRLRRPYGHVKRPVSAVTSNSTSKSFSLCPPLHSTAIPFVNSQTFSLRQISEHALGNGLIAASCKPQGWDYNLVLPNFDARAIDWYTAAFYAIIGEGIAPECGYDWDENLHRLFESDPCALVVDIGANVGLSMCPALSRNFRVLGFEPIPQNLELLRTNAWINGWGVDSVGLVASGVSSVSGEAIIFAPLGNEDNSAMGSAKVATLRVGGSVDSIKIRLISMDDYFDAADSRLIDTIRLVKIDAQGHELPILQGMKKMLSSGHSRFSVFVEVNHMLQRAAGHNPKDIEIFMISLGWKPFCSRPNALEPSSDCGDVTFIHESRITEAQMALK